MGIFDRFKRKKNTSPSGLPDHSPDVPVQTPENAAPVIEAKKGLSKRIEEIMGSLNSLSQDTEDVKKMADQIKNKLVSFQTEVSVPEFDTTGKGSNATRLTEIIEELNSIEQQIDEAKNTVDKLSAETVPPENFVDSEPAGEAEPAIAKREGIVDFDRMDIKELVGGQKLKELTAKMIEVCLKKDLSAQQSLSLEINGLFFAEGVDQKKLSDQLAKFGWTREKFFQFWQDKGSKLFYNAMSAWVNEEAQRMVDKQLGFTGNLKIGFWDKAKLAAVNILPTFAAVGSTAYLLGTGGAGAAITRGVVGFLGGLATGLMKYSEGIKNKLKKVSDETGVRIKEKQAKKHEEIKSTDKFQAELGKDLGWNLSEIDSPLSEKASPVINHVSSYMAVVIRQGTLDKDTQATNMEDLQEANAHIMYQAVSEQIRSSTEDTIEAGEGREVVGRREEIDLQRAELLYRGLNVGRKKDVEDILVELMKDPKIVKLLNKIQALKAFDLDRLAGPQKVEEKLSTEQKVLRTVLMAGAGAAVGVAGAYFEEVRKVLMGLVGGYLGAKGGAAFDRNRKAKAIETETEDLLKKAEYELESFEISLAEKPRAEIAKQVETIKLMSTDLRVPYLLGMFDKRIGLKMRVQDALLKMDKIVLEDAVEKSKPSKDSKKTVSLMEQLEAGLKATNVGIVQSKEKMKVKGFSAVLGAAAGFAAGFAGMHHFIEYRHHEAAERAYDESVEAAKTSGVDSPPVTPPADIAPIPHGTAPAPLEVPVAPQHDNVHDFFTQNHIKVKPEFERAFKNLVAKHPELNNPASIKHIWDASENKGTIIGAVGGERKVIFDEILKNGNKVAAIAYLNDELKLHGAATGELFGKGKVSSIEKFVDKYIASSDKSKVSLDKILDKALRRDAATDFFKTGKIVHHADGSTGDFATKKGAHVFSDENGNVEVAEEKIKIKGFTHHRPTSIPSHAEEIQKPNLDTHAPQRIPVAAHMYKGGGDLPLGHENLTAGQADKLADLQDRLELWRGHLNSGEYIQDSQAEHALRHEMLGTMKQIAKLTGAEKASDIFDKGFLTQVIHEPVHGGSMVSGAEHGVSGGGLSGKIAQTEVSAHNDQPVASTQHGHHRVGGHGGHAKHESTASSSKNVPDSRPTTGTETPLPEKGASIDLTTENVQEFTNNLHAYQAELNDFLKDKSFQNPYFSISIRDFLQKEIDSIVKGQIGKFTEGSNITSDDIFMLKNTSTYDEFKNWASSHLSPESNLLLNESGDHVKTISGATDFLADAKGSHACIVTDMDGLKHYAYDPNSRFFVGSDNSAFMEKGGRWLKIDGVHFDEKTGNIGFDTTISEHSEAPRLDLTSNKPFTAADLKSDDFSPYERGEQSASLDSTPNKPFTAADVSPVSASKVASLADEGTINVRGGVGTIRGNVEKVGGGTGTIHGAVEKIKGGVGTIDRHAGAKISQPVRHETTHAPKAIKSVAEPSHSQPAEQPPQAHPVEALPPVETAPPMSGVVDKHYEDGVAVDLKYKISLTSKAPGHELMKLGLNGQVLGLQPRKFLDLAHMSNDQWDSFQSEDGGASLRTLYAEGRILENIDSKSPHFTALQKQITEQATELKGRFPFVDLSKLPFLKKLKT